MAQIELRNVYKIFGPEPERAILLIQEGKGKQEILAATGHTVGLADITLSVEKSEIFVVMGLSGSGKSTLIRLFNRLIEPSAGSIAFEGTDILKLSPAGLREFRRHATSMVFQGFGLHPHRTVIENVSFGLEVQGVARSRRRARAGKWIETVGLKGYEEQYPSQLSGGMQQRVGLARALCTDPQVLLMDEPFSALDPLIRSDMQDRLMQLQARLSKTIVFITHDLDEALRLGDRIAILKDGALSQVGTPPEILLQPADDYVRAFVKDVNRARALSVAVIMRQPPLRLTDETIGEALRKLREAGENLGWVVKDGRYRGIVDAHQLAAAVSRKPSQPVHAIARRGHCVAAGATIEEAVAGALQSEHPLPVLGADGTLAGVIARDDIARVLEAGPEG